MGGNGQQVGMDSWLEMDKGERIIIFIYVDTQCLHSQIPEI